MLGSFYLSSRLLDYVILLLYLNSLDLYQAENQVFKPTSLFVIVGWGKTMKDLYQSENQVFNPTRLLVLLHCWVGKDWAGPFFPPSKIFRSFYWLVTIVVFRFLLLFHCILWMTDSKERIKFSNQTFYLYCYIVGWGKTGSAHSFPPPSSLQNVLSFYLSFSLSVNVILLLYLKTNEWLIPKR